MEPEGEKAGKPDGARVGAPPRVAWRVIECALLFAALPAVVMATGNHGLLFPLLWGGMAVCLVLLLVDRSFDRSQLWAFRRAVRELPRIAVTFVFGAAFLYFFTRFVHEHPRVVWPGLHDEQVGWASLRLMPFRFPQSNPRLYAVIMVAYPVFSVYPQEVIFRAFFLHRYACVFRARWVLILACGLAFAWGHVIFRNWVAVVLCVPAGVLFAWTYLRTRSTAAASIEHALFGDWVWTVGIGTLFYAGAVGASG